jgi:ABC-type uncharacterized transport system permease subunit
MDLSTINPALLVASLMISATPILLAALGETIVEKSGVLNLGVEGMMIIGAVVGLFSSISFSNPYLGFLFAAIFASIFSGIFGIMVLYFKSNQVATGLGLTLVGLGLSALIGEFLGSQKTELLEPMYFPILSDLKVIGPMFFNHDIILYFSIFLTFTLYGFLKFSRAGMILRAVGENHDAAHALGYNVQLVRMIAIMFGGACSGLGGAYISLVRVPQWTDGLTAGTGWIALAIVVFANWNVSKVILGAYLFGGITVLQLNLQAAGVKIPVEVLSMSPYLVTIFVLVFISVNGKNSSPGSLGKTFHI